MNKIIGTHTEYLNKEITAQNYAEWKKLSKYFNRKIRPYVVMVVIFMALEIIAMVVAALLLQEFIAQLEEQGTLNYLLVLPIVAVVAFRSVVLYLSNFYANKLALFSEQLVCTTLFKRAILNTRLLEVAKSGELANLLGKDAESLSSRMGIRQVFFLTSTIESVIVLAVIYFYSWVVGVAVTVLYPLYFLACELINRRMSKKYYSYSQAQAQVSQLRLKGLQGWRELAVLKKYDYYQQKYNNTYEDTTKKGIKYVGVQAILSSLGFAMVYMLPVLCVVVATLPTLWSASVSIATILIVYMFAGYLNQPLTNFTNALSMISQDKALYKRMSDILFINPADDEGEDVGDIADVDIETEQFTYGTDEVLLKNCNLHAVRGDFVAVRGDSGCGKTTLFKLMIKQNPFEGLDGSIKYNGVPVQQLSREKLYGRLQYVSQNYFVFNDTLRANLCMGDEFSAEDVEKVVDMCCLRDFVNEYGLDMNIEEDGKNISQGQLQRVCIARAMLRRPQCLLLDEPTSALDEATGEKLMANIAEYTKQNGAITFVISHKSDALDRADKVLSLSK